MPKITLDLPQYFLDEINDNIRKINHRHNESEPLSANDIGREALAVFKWSVEQVAQGYAVVSANKNKQLITQISTPNLPAIPPTKG